MEDKVIKFEPITLEQAKKTAKELTQFLKDNNLVINIAGKNYIPVEGWQFVGMRHGLTEIVVSCERTAQDKYDEDDFQLRYKAVVEVVNQHGAVLSRGFAWCSNNEKKKKTFEEYAVASMAQTRAIGKAYRNILGWIVKLGGYEATPAEEIDRESAEQELSKLKVKVFNALNKASITEADHQVRQIESVIGKPAIETVEEANKVLESLDK